MQVDDGLYNHRAVTGLPASLLAAEGETFAVIELMKRQAGLNREKRRELQTSAKALRDGFGRIEKGLPRSEISILSHFLDPGERFGNFWYVVKRLLEPRGAVGNRAYAIAIDVQLLSAYEPDWLKLALDEQTLVTACPEWPRIRERLEDAVQPINGHAPLGLFMIWPRVLRDLNRWGELDAGQRLRVGHAIFALSSVGWTDWFIDAALKLCPDLNSELGALLRASGSVPNGDREATELPLIKILSDTPPAADQDFLSGQSEVDGDGVWPSLLQRLDELVCELKDHPTRDAVADLVTLTQELNLHAVTLPNRQLPAPLRFEACANELVTHLRGLANQDGFDWLEADLIAQIESRWRLALRDRSEPDELEELSEDARVAIHRTDEVATAVREARGALDHARQVVAAVDAELAKAKGFVEQVASKHRRTDAIKQQLDAESAQQVRQEQLIDAASPFGEPFDYSCDYRALLEGCAAVETQREVVRMDREVASPTPPVSPLSLPTSEDIPGEGGASAPPNSTSRSRSEDSVAVESAEAAAQTFERSGDANVPHVESTEHLEPEKASPEEIEPYNDTAGVKCRPIWHLLLKGQPALAYWAATWIGSIDPDTKVPPPDLLAAAALEGALLVPDGGIQDALSTRYAALVPADFSADAPPDWHAALNLLLAASTLRAMILAPGTGAGTVVAYLHQDGRYPALYALVQELRKLSPLLTGFRIEPGVLRQARGEAAIRADLQALQRAAEDWLRVQAPAYTIKFAAATSVWRQWLRAGGEIDALVEPVAHNRMTDIARVSEQLAAMSDYDHVLRLIRETDRKVLNRRRGEDIHAGALDHLLRCVDEALLFPRQWLSLVGLVGKQGNRMREVLERVHTRLHDARQAVEAELLRNPVHDSWGLMGAAQAQTLRAFQGVLAIFESSADLSVSEPSPTEVLGRALLTIPELSLGEDWTVKVAPDVGLSLLTNWSASPVTTEAALQVRLERGDLLGAEMLVHGGLVDSQSALIRQERERWKQTLRREIAECRRSVEVGSAYGYLADADRGRIESRLAGWEAQIEDIRQFDLIVADLKGETARVVEAREVRAQQVREALRGISVREDMQPAVAEVEKALAEGDIATANELLHWLVQGRPAPAELDEEAREGFDDFFPKAMQAIESWLEKGQRREVVEQTLRQGQSIPGIEAQQIAGAQREQAAKMLGSWYDMKAQQAAEQKPLEVLLIGLNLTVRALRRVEKVANREVWALDAAPLEDRHICPVPMFGSSAAGKYRVVCVWGRPTEEELLQWVGDSAASRPVLLLYFGRMTDRKWRDLSRLSKVKRRSFVLLDETLLVYLCYAAGSRLRAWFDVALPFSFSSPYDATAGLVPPEMFYGRGAELDAVRGLNGRCFIYGGRQLGKTALLKRAEQSFHAPSHGHYAKWIDLRAEGIGVSRAAAEVWLTLYEKLKELHVLDAQLAAPSPGKKQGVEGVIRSIRDFLVSNSDRRVLLLLDEADRFFEQDGRNDFEETRRLKQLMDETNRRFKVVFAGLHNVLRMTERPNHPLAHFGEPIEIGPLREGEEVREAADLIRRPMAAAGFDFESRGLVIRILAQTNYYPSLIQLYCSHLLRHMLSQVANKPRLEGPRFVVTDRDIEQVYSSDALRDEIRAKFRLTLQLDPRYEVVAYAMALDLLRNRYSQSDGVAWQTIRQASAMHWWPEGFRDTSELDFRVLLDEMVGLGVLRRVEGGRYVLRNPNVLLLLGTLEEIEAVLIKDREPAVEFESATFRPPLRQSPTAAARSVFTYQQLSKLIERENSVTIITGTLAAGIDGVVGSLQDYLGSDADPIVLTNCMDRQSFSNTLGSALLGREKDLVTSIIVPDSLPWSELWLAEAQQRLKRLLSANKFASLVFVAEPATLWRLIRDDSNGDDTRPPWMSLLHWRDEFLRHWLEERQLQLEPEDRRRLGEVTGYWPALVMELAGDCGELRVLRERLATVTQRWFTNTDEGVKWRRGFGLDIREPSLVIEILARLGEPVEPNELAAVAEMPIQRVKSSLRWGELLGLVRSEGAGFWTVDPIASKILLGVAQ
jgi:hypothetical protein